MSGSIDKKRASLMRANLERFSQRKDIVDSSRALVHSDLTFLFSLLFDFQDDFLLTPRSLDIGLDSLKTNPVNKEKKYQLM